MSIVKTDSFADRLNLCLEKDGFPPKHKGRIQLLSQLVGLTHRGASKWLNGECTPPARKYAQLAKQFNVNEHWLKTGHGPMYDACADTFIKAPLGVEQTVPLYSMADITSSAPCAEKNMQCILPYRGVFYAVRLDTEAMAPQFPAGSVLIMDRYAEPRNGDFVLVSVHGQTNVLFRQLKMEGTERFLYALQPQFESLILSMPHDMMGKLIQAIVSF